MATLSLQQLEKSFGDTKVLHAVDLEVEDGEFLVLVGPSGCGKSTLLRCIAGLESISAGSLRIGEQDMTRVAPKDRNIAMVFQSYALYPHMKVKQNLAFGLKMRKLPAAEVEARVQEAAAILGLGELLDRYPRQLSGGQRQRVAMGRALVRRPAVFLFDEPLSNLDAALRVQMRTELALLHQRLKATMIYVTHDQVEAMTLADRIVVMREGHVQQVGAPLELYHRPTNQFVAGFIGSPSMNLIPGKMLGSDQGQAAVGLLGRRLPLPEGRALGAVGQRLQLGIRPEHLEIVAAGEGDLRATVEIVEPMGFDLHLHLRAHPAEATQPANPAESATTAASPAEDEGLKLIARGETGSQTPPSPGDEVGLKIPPAKLHLFDADSGQAIG